MPKRLCAAIVLGTLCAAGPTLVQQARAMSETEAQQAAATAARAFQDAYNAGKPAAIAALYVQGGVVLTGAGTMLTDHQEIEKAFGGRIKAGWTNETIRVIEAHPEGDDVLFIVDYEITGTGANAECTRSRCSSCTPRHAAKYSPTSGGNSRLTTTASVRYP